MSLAVSENQKAGRKTTTRCVICLLRMHVKQLLYPSHCDLLHNLYPLNLCRSPVTLVHHKMICNFIGHQWVTMFNQIQAHCGEIKGKFKYAYL